MSFNIGKIFKILGKLTDLLLVGRKAGLWSKNPTIGDSVKPKDIK